MITLIPIDPADYKSYLELAIVEYAGEKAKSGNWPAAEALERARADFQRILPDGPGSKDQFVFTIFDEETRRKLGVLWVQVKMDLQPREAFIYDFIIEESVRGRGYGKQALAALDEKLIAMGVMSVGLHVFGHNTTAYELYKKSGYVTTNINMLKTYGKG